MLSKVTPQLNMTLRRGVKHVPLLHPCMDDPHRIEKRHGITGAQHVQLQPFHSGSNAVRKRSVSTLCHRTVLLKKHVIILLLQDLLFSMFFYLLGGCYTLYYTTHYTTRCRRFAGR